MVGLIHGAKMGKEERQELLFIFALGKYRSEVQGTNQRGTSPGGRAWTAGWERGYSLTTPLYLLFEF